MAKNEILIITNDTDRTCLSLEDLCQICGIEVPLAHEFIAYEIIKPVGATQDQWAFDLAQLQRLQTALRLQRHLEINLAGAALALDLLDELERLRARLALLEKHF